MGRIDGILHRLRVLVSPEAYRHEVEREIRFHLDLQAMQGRSSGLSALNAETAARKQFGNVTYAREEVRRMSAMRVVDRVKQDLGYAVRSLRQSPTFTIGVALTLGLGLGVNAAIFDLLDRVFVRPPAGVVNPGEVRRLYNDLYRSGGRMAFQNFRYAHVRAIARIADKSISLGIFTTSKDTATVIVRNRQAVVQRTLANAAYFQLLGGKLAEGRTFDSTEDRIDFQAPVAVISYALWQRMFDGKPEAIGSLVRLGTRPITIIGVTSKNFSGTELDRTDMWMPAGNYGSSDASQHTPWYETYRNNFGVITRVANDNDERRFLAAATGAYREVHIPNWEYDSTALVRSGPIQSALGPTEASQEVSIALRLGGVSLIVLLIALANVSNLLLVRASRRSREIALRRALGAGQGRLFAQFLTESVSLALVSLLVCFVLAFWVGLALRSILLPKVAWPQGPLDIRTVAFGVITTLVVGVVMGLAPAVHAWRPDLVAALRAGNARNGAARSVVFTSLVIMQAALSVVLLVGAGLFVRSLSKVHSVNIGYDIHQTLLVEPLTATRTAPKSLQTMMPSLEQSLAAMPGVKVVASSSLGPMDGESFGTFMLPGRDKLPTVGGEFGPSFLDVSPGYFRATGMRVLNGRVFSETDKSGVVVSEAMAKAYWMGETPLGKCVILNAKSHACETVIGVVSDVNRFRVIEPEQTARYYVFTERPHGVLVVRVSSAQVRDVASRLRAEVRAVVPEALTVRVRSISDIIDPQFRPWRLGAILFTAMGVLALIVATIGVYSVVSYIVSQRTNEMGIRIALGAQISDITRLVVSEGLRTVVIGIALGVVMSLALARLVASMLYGISARDPVVITVAALVLGVIGIAASIFPALRAARVSPMQALRAE